VLRAATRLRGLIRSHGIRWIMRLPYSVSYPVEDAPPGSASF
jgi:hypothetical protein